VFGNKISNAQFASLVQKEKVIDLKPFDAGRLRLGHYKLTPGIVHGVGKIGPKGERQMPVLHDFHDEPTFTLEPHQYVVVEIEEFVVLPDGLVGEFVPPSSFVINGFGLEAGKLDPGYGALSGGRQKLMFGLQNKLGEPNVYSAADGIAYMSVTDYRGLRTTQVEIADDPQVAQFIQWFSKWKRASDDGPQYE
jgi:hypothetical protein